MLRVLINKDVKPQKEPIYIPSDGDQPKGETQPQFMSFGSRDSTPEEKRKEIRKKIEKEAKRK
jgi:hypothetical protein